MPSVEELEKALAAARIAQDQQVIANSVPQAERAATDKYAATSWGGAEYDFTTPSGQLCRLRRLPLEELAKTGVLDRVTRLPGLTAELVTKAQGLPPSAEAELPPVEHIEAIGEVVNAIVPIVVVEPKVYAIPPEGEERVNGLIYVDSIDFVDRVAIMNRVIGPLAKLDNFRN